ncbi:NAD(P)-binding protein [Leucogyrophana mollusca]|uniref:NAD(P)-binding protein n=1 Tax=Leucogyrophana mollusca TaxID=85980 RepID=A0ACB8BE88_9AGAM|nr:NAD(P)-binding protein [Leucogyrophana mollusca]
MLAVLLEFFQHSQWPLSSLAWGALPAAYLLSRFLRSVSDRRLIVSPTTERVLILGATSGVGRTLAHQYASRGARVCVVGRRKDKLDEAVAECGSFSRQSGKVLGIQGDCTDGDDMVNIRATIEKEWGGLDTLIICAGVSALQPLMCVAGVDMGVRDTKPSHATREGIKNAVDISNAALRGNFTSPFVAAVTFIPLLTNSSKSPSILLLSSVAAVIPPPTRALYAATKSASLVLFQSLAIEHPDITFTFFLPATIEGDFRSSAVDRHLNGSSPRLHEADPNKHGMKRGVVAARCIRAIDNGEKTVFIPRYMRIGQLLYWIWPAFTEWRARVKYNYSAR